MALNNSLGTDLLDVLDDIRGIPGELGLRPYKVTVIVRTWTGTRPGVDASTSTDTPAVITVDIGQQHPKVRQLTDRDVIASGGQYTDRDFRIGPITPPTTGGNAGDAPYPAGIRAAVFDPPTSSSPTEVFFRVEGPGMPAGGTYFKKIGQDVSRPLHYEFTVRDTGETP